MPAGATRVVAAEFVVDVLGPEAPCQAGASCTVRLQLHALGDFHVNRKYPHKFVAAADASAPSAAPSLSFENERAATLTVPFEARAPGPVRVVGIFKLSVCNDESCVIEEPAISIDVPVS